MNKYNTIGVDLPKNVIQVGVVSPANKVLQNKELMRKKLTEFLVKQKPALVAFEACATAHYWSCVARRHGHQTKIIPTLAVAPFRQGHKAEQNDALAVAEAARRPNIKEAPIKTVTRQSMQAIQRSRELLIQNVRTAWALLTKGTEYNKVQGAEMQYA